jgi:transposase
MAMLDQIEQDKQRISGRLMRLDAERTKLSDQLDELEIAERALKRFGGKGVAAEKRRVGRAAKTATAAGAEPKARGRQQARGASLGEATLKAVQAHAKGASADEVLEYLSRKFGLTIRPNHLGSALHRHRRAGRLESRDQRWYLPSLA